MEKLVSRLDRMTENINFAVDHIKKDPCEWNMKEFMAHQDAILNINASNRHRKHVQAGNKAVGTMLRIKARTRGLQYVLTKPLKKKKIKKSTTDNQLTLF